jgi:hypothetical protein
MKIGYWVIIQIYVSCVRYRHRRKKWLSGGWNKWERGEEIKRQILMYLHRGGCVGDSWILEG